nr:protein kinase-like domain-containing protein [Tanacetum cinerariifolium]
MIPQALQPMVVPDFAWNKDMGASSHLANNTSMISTQFVIYLYYPRSLPYFVSVSLCGTDVSDIPVKKCYLATTFATHDENETNHQALLSFKSMIRGPYGSLISSWKDSFHFCKWTGVSCRKRHRRVNVLRLESLGLEGALSSHVGNISFLHVLSLRNNSFQGSIPHELGRLSRLRVLFLDRNNFHGAIPTNITGSSYLEELWLGRIKLVGSIPKEISYLSKLTLLTIHSNYLTSGIPPFLGNITSMKSFSSSENPFGGNILDTLGHWKSLSEFGCGECNLNGTIPRSMYNLSLLTIFSLPDNQLAGSFLLEIGGVLPNLEFFQLGMNQLNGLLLPSIYNCSKLQIIEMHDNNLSGSCLNLGGNNLHGNIPSSIGDLTTLNLRDNRFTGKIPSTIGWLRELQVAGLFDNQFLGPIPDAIENLSLLNILYLYSNTLERQIPPSLGNCHQLSSGVGRGVKDKDLNYVSNKAVKDGAAPSITIAFGSTPEVNVGHSSSGLTASESGPDVSFASASNSLGICVSMESDDTMNEDTPVGVASAIKEGVKPSMGDMMVEKEKIRSLEETTVLESFQTLTTPVTTTAGNAPGVMGLMWFFRWILFMLLVHDLLILLMVFSWGRSSSTRLFSFQFSSMDGLVAMLENGPWFIRNNPLILKKWHLDENLLKEDDRSSYARIMIELRADVDLKDNIVVAMPKITREGHYTCNVRVEVWYQWGTTNLVNNGANSSGSFFMNIDIDGEFASNTPIGVKIDKIERQICEGKLRLLDNDGNPLVPTGIVESDSEVEVVFDETANLRISTSGKDGSDKCYGTNSLLEQWRDTYLDNDNYDPYDDDMYENHDLSNHLQSICDDLDITLSDSISIEVEDLKMLNYLDLPDNNLIGDIPSSLGSCISLSSLSIKRNLLTGIIPQSLSSLRGLVALDLSNKNLSGHIPRFFEQFSLKYMNLSFNDFEVNVPMKIVFMNATAFLVFGNNRLCGGLAKLELPKCTETKKHKNNFPSLVIVILIASTSVAILCFVYVMCKKKRNDQRPSQVSTSKQFLTVSYNELLKATDGFSKANLIGTGGVSSVYKGMLDNIDDDSFVAWRNIRHRNLLKIITSRSSIDFQGNGFKALIYEFMPNGSLHDWLHSYANKSRLNLFKEYQFLWMWHLHSIIFTIPAKQRLFTWT